MNGQAVSQEEERGTREGSPFRVEDEDEDKLSNNNYGWNWKVAHQFVTALLPWPPELQCSDQRTQ